MINFLIVFIMYTGFWIIGMYFILHRIYTIRKRTEQHMHDFDGQFAPPSYWHAWVASIVLWTIWYCISVGVILVFLRN